LSFFLAAETNIERSSNRFPHLTPTSLSRLIDAEGRARGRRQRQKARAKKELPTFDLDAPFEH
jgi:hypothetical protein